MKRIRDAQTIVGMLEGGELNAALSGEITETLSKLKTMSEENHKKTFKGSVSLILSLKLHTRSIHVTAVQNCTLPM